MHVSPQHFTHRFASSLQDCVAEASSMACDHRQSGMLTSYDIYLGSSLLQDIYHLLVAHSLYQ